MPSHKFRVGDIVAINPAISRFVPGGVFEVIKQLPGGNEPEYRIKSANEPHARAARESELIKLRGRCPSETRILGLLSEDEVITH